MGAKGISGRLTRRLLLGALLSSAAGVALAGGPLTSVRPVARARGQWKPDVRGAGDLIAEARLGGKIGFVVADARTGEILESHNPLLALPPASVAKTFTTLYALKELGPRHRFTTRLIATGPVEGGRLNGDLILAGGGDPTLDTDALADMAEKLKNAGIREIAGRFLAYSEKLPTIFSIDPDQPDQMGYNPSVSGLNLNYNRVHFKWKRESGEYAVTLDAPAHKFSTLVRIARMRIVDRSMPVYTYADNGGADQWTVARAALGKAGSRWLPVRKPELYAAEVFKTLARSYGVVLPNAGVAHAGHAGRALVSRESPVLHDILRDMLYWSTNLTAEVVGLTSTLADGEGARTLKSLCQRDERLGEIGTGDAQDPFRRSFWPERSVARGGLGHGARAGSRPCHQWAAGNPEGGSDARRQGPALPGSSDQGACQDRNAEFRQRACGVHDRRAGA